MAGNCLHFLLILASFILLVFQRDNRTVLVYGLSLGAGFLLFCGMVTWSPWNSHFHLPFFILLSPAAAIALNSVMRRKASVLLSAALLLGSLPWVFQNSTKNILGDPDIFTRPRLEQYLIHGPFLVEPYREAVRFLKDGDYNRIGLIIDRFGSEYPLMVLLHEAFPEGYKLEHVHVRNVSAALRSQPSFKNLNLHAIVAIYPASEKKHLRLQGIRYSRAWSSGIVAVFVRDIPVTDPASDRLKNE